MSNNEIMKHKGVVTYELRDKEGHIKETREIPNLIVNAGKAAMAGLFLEDVAVDAFDYIALGTGTTAAAAGDTALESEITTGGGERAQATGTRMTTAVTNDTSQLEATFNFTGSHAVTESGVFNASSSGDMAARQVFDVLNVSNGDQLTVRWRIQHS